MEKIIVVGPVPPAYSGQSIAVQMLVNELKDKDLEHSVINLSNKIKKVNNNTLIRALEYIRIIFSYIFHIVGERKIVYITVAQSRNGFIRDFIFINIAKLFRHKVIAHIHGGNFGNFFSSQDNFFKQLIIFSYKKVDKIIVLGEKLKNMFSFSEELMKKVVVVPNGLPFKTMLKKPKNIADLEKIKILYLSNLIETKGYVEVLKSVDILVNQYGLNVHADFAGEFLRTPGDDILFDDNIKAQKWFMDFIDKKNLKNNITYHGVVKGKKKDLLLMESHFFVLPTRYSNEGQPISIIEAMAYGNIILTTDYRAITDLVINYKSGFFVEFGNPVDIAEKISLLIFDKDKYSNMSEFNLKYFMENFTYEKHVERLIYEIIN